jgi:hypothetical protein
VTAFNKQFPGSDEALDEYVCNWYFADVLAPFTRGDVLSNGGISIGIIGTDSWEPGTLFVYGLDTAQGRPNEVVDLVAVPEWNLGPLDASRPSVPLTVI